MKKLIYPKQNYKQYKLTSYIVSVRSPPGNYKFKNYYEK